MNSFQFTTVWVLSLAASLGCLWLLVWWLGGRRRPGLSVAQRRVYQISGSVVEIRIGDGWSISDLRALLESIRADPSLPPAPLVLCDNSARMERLTDADVRTRLAVFLDILRPPVVAVVASAAITASAAAAQRYAAAAGIRMELFQDREGARRWLGDAMQI